MKIIITVVFAVLFLSAKTQINIVKLNCPDSFGFISNINAVTRNVEFYFHNEKTPDMFYVENFSHQDMQDLIYKNDKSKISRVRLVRENYTASIHDFVYCYNKENQLLFYYILKDWREEKQLTP